jgi:hypothetical protein
MTDSLDPQSHHDARAGIFPGAQRALFRRYHIGGCASCAFQPGETWPACARATTLNVAEVIQHIQTSHQQDEELQISPAELAALQKGGAVRLVDIRSREEFEATRIEGGGAVVAAGDAGNSGPLAARGVDGHLRSSRAAKPGRGRLFHWARVSTQGALPARRH